MGWRRVGVFRPIFRSFFLLLRALDFAPSQRRRRFDVIFSGVAVSAVARLLRYRWITVALSFSGNLLTIWLLLLLFFARAQSSVRLGSADAITRQRPGHLFFSFLLVRHGNRLVFGFSFDPPISMVLSLSVSLCKTSFTCRRRIQFRIGRSKEKRRSTPRPPLENQIHPIRCAERVEKWKQKTTKPSAKRVQPTFAAPAQPDGSPPNRRRRRSQ